MLTDGKTVGDDYVFELEGAQWCGTAFFDACFIAQNLRVA
jgi:hypothetical protein